MQIPLEIYYQNVEKTEAVERLIQAKVDKLEKICDYITSARVAVERRHRPQTSANPYEVRIGLRVPPGHELVVRRVSNEAGREEPLPATIRRAFDAMRKQLQELVERQRGEVKVSPSPEMTALVEKLYPEEGYGFLRTVEGHQVYFHKNSVLHGHWESLTIGVGVRFTQELGEKGLQATTVELVNRPPRL